MDADNPRIEVVAPFVGAWIEIDSLTTFEGKEASLPSWERGLKWFG